MWTQEGCKSLLYLQKHTIRSGSKFKIQLYFYERNRTLKKVGIWTQDAIVCKATHKCRYDFVVFTVRIILK